MVVGDTVLSYVRPAFVNSYPGVCGRRREGQTRVRAGGRPRLSPVPAVSLPPRPPRAAATHGDPCQEPEDGRTDGRATYAAALTDHRRWTAHEDDAAARLFVTNYIAVTYVKFREISQYCRENKSENQSPENATIDALVAAQPLSRGGGRRQ